MNSLRRVGVVTALAIALVVIAVCEFTTFADSTNNQLFRTDFVLAITSFASVVPTKAPWDSTHDQYPQDKKSLLIIQGAYRTFDYTVASIIQNLIMANAPCDVVISTDTAPPEDAFALKALQPYLVSPRVTTPAADRKTNEKYQASSIEFVQHYRALQHVNISKYAFIMKTRTDVVIRQRMAFTTAVGQDTVQFKEAFPRFMHALRQFNASVRPREAIMAWFMTAGNPFYIPRMVGVNIPMAWSPVGPWDIVQPLDADVSEACECLWGEDDAKGWEMVFSDVRRMQELIGGIASRNHVMYIAGNTWVGFGERDDFLEVYTTMYRDYGRFSWNEWRGPRWDGSVTWPHGPHVTESHFRLSHLHHNKTLVDLLNAADHMATFVLHEFCFGWKYLEAAEGLGVYILRHRQISCVDHLPPEVELKDAFFKEYNYPPVIVRGQG